MVKKGQYIKSLSENEYTDFEEIRFSDGDGISDSILSNDSEVSSSYEIPVQK